MAKHTWTDHSGDAGFRFQSKRTGATVYDAEEQGLDPDGGRYVLVCVHNRLVNFNSVAIAIYQSGPNGCLPDICPACKDGDFNERALTSEEDAR